MKKAPLGTDTSPFGDVIKIAVHFIDLALDGLEGQFDHSLTAEVLFRGQDVVAKQNRLEHVRRCGVLG